MLKLSYYNKKKCHSDMYEVMESHSHLLRLPFNTSPVSSAKRIKILGLQCELQESQLGALGWEGLKLENGWWVQRELKISKDGKGDLQLAFYNHEHMPNYLSGTELKGGNLRVGTGPAVLFCLKSILVRSHHSEDSPSQGFTLYIVILDIGVTRRRCIHQRESSLLLWAQSQTNFSYHIALLRSCKD